MAHCYLALVVGDKEKKYVTLTGFPNTLRDAKVGPSAKKKADRLARPEIFDPRLPLQILRGGQAFRASYSPKGKDNPAGGEALGCHSGDNSSP